MGCLFFAIVTLHKKVIWNELKNIVEFLFNDFYFFVREQHHLVVPPQQQLNLRLAVPLQAPLLQNPENTKIVKESTRHRHLNLKEAYKGKRRLKNQTKQNSPLLKSLQIKRMLMEALK